MGEFKYYKRGKGELDTSNFPSIAADGDVIIDNLDEKTFMSLLALNEYLKLNNLKVELFINGYVHHMRSDKDVYPVYNLYKMLDNISFNRCNKVQHTDSDCIQTDIISKELVESCLPNLKGSILFVGADSSVPKFFPDVDIVANKNRSNGKVVSISFDTDNIDNYDHIVIVDDILGGGATVDMLVDIIEDSNKSFLTLNLWVEYNEGIHKKELLDRFDFYDLGQEI